MSQFDPKKSLVMAVFKTVLGHDLQPGTRLTIVTKPDAAGEVDTALANRLWASGIAVYDDAFSPTPVETREQEAERLVELETLDGGWFAVRAPWLRKPEKVQGRVKADRLYRRIVEAGRPENGSADLVEDDDDEPVVLPPPAEAPPSEGVVLDPGKPVTESGEGVADAPVE